MPDLPLQYLDFAHWQRQTLQGERLRELIQYWEDHYVKFPHLQASDLAFARSGDSINRRGGVELIALDSAFCRDLKVFSAAMGSTPYMVFLMATTALLSVCSRREKVTVASYFANRAHPGIQSLIGDFATPHRLGVDFSDDPSVSELLSQIRATVAGATSNQEIPIALLLRMLRKSGKVRPHHQPAGPWVTCEFNAHRPVQSPESLTIERTGILANLSKVPAPQPLRFIWRESGAKGATLSIGYHTDMFEQAAVQSMLAGLVGILRKAVHEPLQRFSALSKYVAIPEQSRPSR